MGYDLANKTSRKCALCKHWNGAIGSTTITSKNNGMAFSFDHNEKQQCFKKSISMPSWSTCASFEARYK